MNNIDLEKLKAAIYEAGGATYASGKEDIKEKQSDGSTTIRYGNGEYKFHDNYFGGEPYGGREVVFLNDKAIWMMVYYGFVYQNTEPDEVYPFLMESLRNSTPEIPYRGPELFEKENFRYENKLIGDVGRFSGIEKIFKDGNCVYEASYIGGFVDQ